MNDNNINNGFGWIEIGLQIIDKYNIKTIFKALFVVVLVAVTVGFINNPTYIFEQYKEWIDQQHTEAMYLREQNDMKIHILTEKLNSFNLAASQAVSTYVYAGVSTVYNGSNLLYVGLPSMVGSSVGMGNSLTESNALSANFTLCHSYYLQCALRAKHRYNLQLQTDLVCNL